MMDPDGFSVDLEDPTAVVVESDDGGDDEVSRISQSLSRRNSFVEPMQLEATQMVERAQPEPPKNNRIRFQRKFFSLIVATLNGAAKSTGEERNAVLEQLRKHLSAKIEPKVIAYFLEDGSIRAGQGYGNRHYFNLAAEWLKEQPEFYFAHMEPFVNALRSNETFREIYALLFYFWIFEPDMAEVKNLNVFVSGAEALFADDLSHTRFVYRPIYQSVRRVLSKGGKRWNGALKAVLMDLWSLHCRYTLFYEKKTETVLFVQHHFYLEQRLAASREEGRRVVVMRMAELGNVEMNDAFVRIVINHLATVKREEVLIRYLTWMGLIFSQVQLSDKTALFLQSELYARSKPGNPYYYPDDARRAAAASLAVLYPRGRKVRRLVALLFRLLQPYYSLRAVILFWWMLLLTVLQKLTRFGPKAKSKKTE